MWWYWIIDVVVWAAGLLMLWKAFDSWRGYNKLKLTSPFKKLD